MALATVKLTNVTDDKNYEQLVFETSLDGGSNVSSTINFASGNISFATNTPPTATTATISNVDVGAKVDGDTIHIRVRDADGSYNTSGWIVGTVSGGSTTISIGLPLIHVSSEDVSGFSTIPTGINFTPNGNFLFFLNVSLMQVLKINLTTAWDISTIGTVQQTLSDALPTTSGAGIVFSQDGTKLYTHQNTQNLEVIHQHNLATAWDLSSYVDSVSSVVDNGVGRYNFKFSGDGTKLIKAVSGAISLEEYTLTTAWDVTTMGANQTKTKILTESTAVYDIIFYDNGLRMIATTYGSILYEYTLTTAYDIGTLTYAGRSFDVSSYNDNMRATYINESLKKMYIAGITANSSLNEFNMSDV